MNDLDFDVLECVIHHRLEPWVEGESIWCPECWHTYSSKADVERVCFEQWGERLPFDQIYSCPLCVHDW